MRLVVCMMAQNHEQYTQRWATWEFERMQEPDVTCVLTYSTKYLITNGMAILLKNAGRTLQPAIMILLCTVAGLISHILITAY